MVDEIFIAVILVFVGIAVSVVIHVCILRSALNRGNEGGVTVIQRISSIGIKRMSNEELDMLPCFEYTAGEKGTSTVDCVMCLENFKAGERCRLLPNCRHSSFHAQCIDSWLLKTPICPICRTCANPPKIDGALGEETSVAGDFRIDLT